MTDDEPEREYKYLDMDELRSTPIEPVDDPADVVLEQALLDIIQLAEESGVGEDVIDSVIRKIQDGRAAKCRRRFTLHVREDDPDK